MLLLVVACCWELLRKVLTRSNFWVNNSPNFFKFVPWSPKLSATILPFALLFLSSFNTVGATHAHYTWSPKYYGLYPSHDALQVATLLGAVASVCTLLPTSTQQLPSLLAHQCWELFGPFASRFTRSRWRCFQSQDTGSKNVRVISTILLLSDKTLLESITLCFPLNVKIARE